MSADGLYHVKKIQKIKPLKNISFQFFRPLGGNRSIVFLSLPSFLHFSLMRSYSLIGDDTAKPCFHIAEHLDCKTVQLLWLQTPLFSFHLSCLFVFISAIAYRAPVMVFFISLMGHVVVQAL